MTTAIMMRSAAAFAALILVSSVCSSGFEVSSTNPSSGEIVTITGSGNPGQEVEFQTSFQMNLPVVSGKYEYEASSVKIPQKPNQFGVTVEGVKDLNLGVKIGLWITKGFKAKDGVVSLSQSDVPPGRYDIKVFGEALEGRSSVSATIKAGTVVKADSAGKYSLDVDTSGIPGGAYQIEGDGETKTIQVGSISSTLGNDNIPGPSPEIQSISSNNGQPKEDKAVAAPQNEMDQVGINDSGSAIFKSKENEEPKVSLLDQIKGILGF
jgi:hypothetical protein